VQARAIRSLADGQAWGRTQRGASIGATRRAAGERDAYRLTAQEAIHNSHAQHIQLVRLRANLRRMRSELRSLRPGACHMEVACVTAARLAETDVTVVAG